MDDACSGHETPKRNSYSSAVNAPENTSKKKQKKEKKSEIVQLSIPYQWRHPCRPRIYPMPLRSEIELRDLKRLFLSPKPAILLAYCVGVYPALNGVVGMPEQLECKCSLAKRSSGSIIWSQIEQYIFGACSSNFWWLASPLRFLVSPLKAPIALRFFESATTGEKITEKSGSFADLL